MAVAEEQVNVVMRFIDGFSAQFGKASDSVFKEMDKLEKKSKGMRQQFDMTSLSVLFAGMQMKRFSEGIIRSTVTTFNKISEGSTAAGQALLSFSANWTFLKFEIGRAIGEALIPLLPHLISIFGVLTGFAQKHPKGLTAILFGVFAVGTAALIVGSIGTLISSLTGVTIAEALTNATAMGTALERNPKSLIDA